MANDLTKIMPKILTRGLSVLRERAGMPRNVNASFSAQAATKGKTIDIPVPTSIDVISVTPSNTPPTPTDATPGEVQVKLDQWKQNKPFYLTDDELTQIDRNAHFVPMKVEEAMRALAQDVNKYLFAQYKEVYGVFGTAGTTPFATTVAGATQTRKLLNQQLCPSGERRAMVDFDCEANMLALAAFSDLEKTGDRDVKIEGEIGRKYGIDWFADDDVPLHTKGTLSDGSNPRCLVDNSGGYAIGVDTINVDSTTLTGTLVLGDILTFSGHTQTYTVVENTASAEYSAGAYTAATNAITSLKISPALKAAVADNEQCDLTGTHRVNLVFHRDAFAFAMRPLVSNTQGLSLGNQIMSVQDPQTGIVLRLEVSRQHKQVVWEFDILYGAKLVRPELAVRLIG